MARWSDAMKLNQFEQWRLWLDGHSGCYQIGYYSGGDFQPRYVGRGENIYSRIKSYMHPTRCHNDHIRARLSMERHNLWFRYLRTERFKGLEARQQNNWGVGFDGLYEWNKRIERSCLQL